MEQKTVLITGGSGGIGQALARRFGEAGYRVAVTYHAHRDRAQALVEELQGLGCPAAAVYADVSDPAQVAAAVDNVLDKFCQLDILVCNAGVSWTGLLGDMTDEEWRRVCGVNLDGVFYACRSVIPHFVHRKAGKIITISSMWGQVGGSCETAYSAAKAGVIGLTKALAKELAPSGITVNCVAPGMIDTEMNRHLDEEAIAALREETPLGRIGTPGDVAESVLFLAGRGGDFMTGQVLSPNGGLVI
ncbi:MAG: SDR family NAD(P)-dependent oxidoreductase [Pseudoflavonifractor sp.]